MYFTAIQIFGIEKYISWGAEIKSGPISFLFSPKCFICIPFCLRHHTKQAGSHLWFQSWKEGWVRLGCCAFLIPQKSFPIGTHTFTVGILRFSISLYTGQVKHCTNSITRPLPKNQIKTTIQLQVQRIFPHKEKIITKFA